MDKIKVFWIEESAVLTLEDLERLRKAMYEVQAITFVSVEEVTRGFQQALNSFATSDLFERMEELNNRCIEIMEEKPVKKPYHSFIPETIGRQRRK